MGAREDQNARYWRPRSGWAATEPADDREDDE